MSTVTDSSTGVERGPSRSHPVRRLALIGVAAVAVGIGVASAAWACTTFGDAPTGYSSDTANVGPMLSVHPGSAPAGAVVRVEGANFQGAVNLYWQASAGALLGTVADGSDFATSITIPASPLGASRIVAVGHTTSGVAAQRDVAFSVIDGVASPAITNGPAATAATAATNPEAPAVSSEPATVAVVNNPITNEAAHTDVISTEPSAGLTTPGVVSAPAVAAPAPPTPVLNGSAANGSAPQLSAGANPTAPSGPANPGGPSGVTGPSPAPGSGSSATRAEPGTAVANERNVVLSSPLGVPGLVSDPADVRTVSANLWSGLAGGHRLGATSLAGAGAATQSPWPSPSTALVAMALLAMSAGFGLGLRRRPVEVATQRVS